MPNSAEKYYEGELGPKEKITSKMRQQLEGNLAAKFVVTLYEKLATELMNAEADEDYEKYGVKLLKNMPLVFMLNLVKKINKLNSIFIKKLINFMPLVVILSAEFSA